jgi:hypothetical protein
MRLALVAGEEPVAARPDHAVTGRPDKFNFVSILSTREPTLAVPNRLEGVDAASHAIYKTRNGGGRNPAAAIL